MDFVLSIFERIIDCFVDILRYFGCPCIQQHRDEEEINLRQMQIAQDLDEAMRLPLLPGNLSRHSSEDNLGELQYENEFASNRSSILKNENYRHFPTSYGAGNVASYQYFNPSSTPSLSSVDL